LIEILIRSLIPYIFMYPILFAHPSVSHVYNANWDGCVSLLIE